MHTVCVVASTWYYSPVNPNAQAGVSSFSVIVTNTTGSHIANKSDIIDNEIVLRVNDGKCGTNVHVVAVSIVNICGLQGNMSSSLAQRVNNSLANTALFNNVCTYDDGAANKDRKL